MQPRRGRVSVCPHVSQDLAHAESVPSYPAFSTHQLAKAEHYAVSSLDISLAPRLVLLKYSTILGLSAAPVNLRADFPQCKGHPGKFFILNLAVENYQELVGTPSLQAIGASNLVAIIIPRDGNAFDEIPSAGVPLTVAVSLGCSLMFSCSAVTWDFVMTDFLSDQRLEG